MSLINKILHYHYLITPIFYCIWIDFMQIFTENVFKKIRHSRRLMGIRRYTRDRLKTKSSTLKDYKIIYQRYFNIYFQNTDFIQLVYYSFFLYIYLFARKLSQKLRKCNSTWLIRTTCYVQPFTYYNSPIINARQYEELKLISI